MIPLLIHGWFLPPALYNSPTVGDSVLKLELILLVPAPGSEAVNAH